MKKPSASIAFQILPQAKNSKSKVAIIDQVIALVKASGVIYEVGPMETTMEGDLAILIGIVHQAQDVALKAGAKQVFTNVKILYDPNGVMTIAEKVTKHR